MTKKKQGEGVFFIIKTKFNPENLKIYIWKISISKENKTQQKRLPKVIYTRKFENLYLENQYQ